MVHVSVGASESQLGRHGRRHARWNESERAASNEKRCERGACRTGIKHEGISLWRSAIVDVELVQQEREGGQACVQAVGRGLLEHGHATRLQ